MSKLYIYDTTLRDGAQTEGISYSLHDKIILTKRLDEFGIDFIEGGWPYSNPKDTELFAYFKKNRLKKAQIVPFGSTSHPANSAQKDKNLKSLIAADTEYVTIFGKTWDMHVTGVLHVGLDDNLKIIHDSVKFLSKNNRKVFYDAEHFFDGYKANPEYARKTLKAALDAGARLVILCDTNGGTLFSDVRRIIDEIKDCCAGVFGIHCHNDLGLAAANSLAALEQGACQIQGTINGYGERCGNADLTQIMAIAKFKMNCSFAQEKKISDLTKLSYFVSEISNMVHGDNQPITGRSAFAHKGGVHIDAMLKNPFAYENMDPELVGNRRRFVISELAGKSSLVQKARELEYDLDKKSARAKRLHKHIQKLEQQGYQFDSAEGSFKLLLHREFKKFKKFFELQGFSVIVEKLAEGQLISHAIIKLSVNGQIQHTVAEGDGPVNALDTALRKALMTVYPQLNQMRLIDFKVRVLDAKDGTAAKVRVLIESQDSKESWITIGVSENIIEASYYALADSIEYKLLKDIKE